MDRAALYCRVSTQGQSDDGTSLTSQLAACREYALSHGYPVVAEYDEVYTGTELWDRPKLTALRDAVKAGSVTVIVCYAIDRLSRDPVHLGVILSECEHRKARVEFVTEPLDESPEGALLRFIRGYVAQVEHAKIRERTMRGKRAVVASGRLLNAGPRLYGYEAADGRRTIHPVEAATVREVYRLCVEEGRGTLTIARTLNARGIPSPSIGKMASRYPDTPLWSKSQVRRLITNPAYKGESVAWRWRSRGLNRNPELLSPDEWQTLPEGTTPAIVPSATWDAAQRQMRDNRGEATRNQWRPFLLRGLVVCAVCGRRCSPDKEKGHLRIYRCASRHSQQGACGASRIPAERLEAWVWQEARAFIYQHARGESAALHTSNDDGTLAAELAAARLRMERITASQDRIMNRAAQSESIPWEVVERQIASSEAEKAGVRLLIASLEAQQSRVTSAAAAQLSLTEWCAEVVDTMDEWGFEEQRTALETLRVRVIASGADWHVTTDSQP